MQFLIIAHDHADEQALTRRMAVREAHIAMIDKLKDAGKVLFGAAILDDQEKMIGSTIIGDFLSRKELESWLEEEPYVTGRVWKDIEIKKCKVGPSFMSK